MLYKLFGLLFDSVARGAIETVCTDLALRQTDALNEGFKLIELQRSDAEAFANLLHHSSILRRVSGGILIKILVGISLQFLNDTTGNKLKIALGS